MTRYVVILEDETFLVDPTSVLVKELNSLMPYTTYTSCVAANTSSGPSRITCATQTTLETGQ